MRTTFTSVVAGIALLSLTACTTPPPVREMPEVVATASTPAEHTQIADYYGQKAANYEAEAAKHKKMASSYVSSSKGQGNSMASHCNSLQQNFLDSAKQARSLEKAHRDLARIPGGQ